MAPLGGKGKSKAKDGRQSRSRNTTPSSVVSNAVSNAMPKTAYLDIEVGHLMVPTNILYDDILERHGGSGGIPDPKHLEALENDLKTLSQLAEIREAVCDGGMRELSNRRKERLEEERENEQALREAEEKASLKRAADDEELDRERKESKVKVRKDRSRVREERPLAHGAHGIARQDGTSATSIVSRSSTPSKKPKTSHLDSSPTKAKQATTSGSSSSLSPASQLASPTVGFHTHSDNRKLREDSSSSEDSHQPPPAASISQYQTFGADPLAFDDPTIYHIREVMDGMTDEEKKEIYGVSSFPHDDLSDLIAGVPPDKDFSNAKPSNQVNANTFAAYLEPHLRPLTEEDMAFLKERGDRVTPFLMPPRGRRHYTEIWAEEDGSISSDNAQHGHDSLPANQPRGSLDQMDDDIAETDQVSAGPLLNRLLSTMRFEHRSSPGEEKEKTNGMINADIPINGFTNGDIIGENSTIDVAPDDRLPPATLLPESASQSWKVPIAKLDYAQIDDRLRAELRYIGFLGQDEEPDYDAHYDDEVAQRLRCLQTELKKQVINNGARKARLLHIAQERMAHQEFSTILDDLDGQVQQAYLKRTRTLGKGKKNAKRPGGAGGGSHYVAGAPGSSAGTAKPGIGDAAKTLMERRKKWIDTIKPIFSDEVTRVRRGSDTIFTEPEMSILMAAEREKWDEEAE